MYPFGAMQQYIRLLFVTFDCIIETLNHTRVENEMAETDTTNNGFEKQIWDAACVLRGNLDASEYKSAVLVLHQARKLYLPLAGFSHDFIVILGRRQPTVVLHLVLQKSCFKFNLQFLTWWSTRANFLEIHLRPLRGKV